jgi:hypothetical protein
MKLSIILLLLSTLLTNCESKRVENNRKTRSLLKELYTIYFVGDVYVFRNICPTASKIFEPGVYEISLEKGEALYFDISPRLNAANPYQSYSYYLGISKDIPSNNISMNKLGDCEVNRNITDPKPMRTASDTSYAISNSDSEFNYYRYSLTKAYNSDIPTAKAINKPIKFKIKIPETGSIF